MRTKPETYLMDRIKMHLGLGLSPGCQPFLVLPGESWETKLSKWGDAFRCRAESAQQAAACYFVANDFKVGQKMYLNVCRPYEQNIRHETYLVRMWRGDRLTVEPMG